MGRRLDQAGIFMAQARAWSVIFSDKSDAVAVEIEFSPIISEFFDGEWQPWRGSEDTYVKGRFYIIGKDGGINNVAVKQLALSLGWDGELTSICDAPPQVPVQIQVEGEPYKDNIIFKAQWMNPKDHVPGSGGASPAEIGRLQARYGGLLKTAAERITQGKPAPTATAAPATVEKDPEDDLPF